MRLYLTGLLSFFGSSEEPTTTTQTSLGLLGAIVYYVVLSSFDPFVDPTDDLLAKVAAFQVIITFFFATMLQAQENAKEDEAGDPSGVWSNAIFSTICVLVGLSTLVLAVFMVFAGARDVRNAASKAASIVNERVASRRHQGLDKSKGTADEAKRGSSPDPTETADA